MNASRLNTRRNSTWIAVVIGALFLAVILFTQLARNPSQYVARLQQARDQKDLQFRNDPDSPIPKAVRDTFGGLAYFPVQEAYRVEATLRPAARPDTVQMMSTQGDNLAQPVVEVGQVRFALQGRTHELTAFAYLDQADRYFVPFYDLTSGVSTYGGGRYLDVPKQQPLVLDFNRAYNPYCVYNESYLCPLPPRQNKLNLEIRAGELNPEFAPPASP